jgi:voltage-gated sodium channel type II alpha
VYLGSERVNENLESKYLVSDLEEDGGDEGHLDEAIVADAITEADSDSKYPADCCPDKCYRRFPFLAGDDDSPFWQGWANLRHKTFRLIENKYFETAVITMILLSSLALVSFHTDTVLFSYLSNNQ